MTTGTVPEDNPPARAGDGAPDLADVPAGLSPALQDAFSELGRIRLWDTPMFRVLDRVAALARASVPGADQVSVTLVDRARATTVAFTGSLAVQLDERQYADGFGPCTDAAREGGTIPMLDLASEERYPGFVAAARRAGVTGILSVGLPVPGRVVGGLNIYHLGAPGSPPLDGASVRAAEAFARYAAVAVANAGLVRSAEQLAEQMRDAMASRATIEQAKGVLMARTGCTPDEAFAALAARSRRANLKLALVAAEIVAAAQSGAAEDTAVVTPPSPLT